MIRISLICIVLTLACGCAPRTITWHETRSIPSPQARQAAAADERFVYAIDSTTIAKLDRETGALISTSAGDAHHLNSGLLFEGRLYCAHSNFPLKPESSQIMVLDVETMNLSTFKDFGNFGGSLTWVVRHRGRWWCNFARYGADNAQTFLVEFDDNWRELRRFTYPKELIGQLGKYSISGGVWRDGMLIVTGHDEPFIYRLRLPKRGNVLELIDRTSVPFTGQGIANDPVTKGLVGIDRKNRKVIFTSN